MKASFDKLMFGYRKFKQKYSDPDFSVMEQLAIEGQEPDIMIVSCCDSRVDPALILNCAPGDLFIVRNVANIIPPYENDEFHHGTSAALEFGICYLKVKHLIIWGHSGCGGIKALLHKDTIEQQNDFIGKWVELVDGHKHKNMEVDAFAKQALTKSYNNCMTFPWIKNKVDANQLSIHRWFFDIQHADLLAYNSNINDYITLDS